MVAVSELELIVVALVAVVAVVVVVVAAGVAVIAVVAAVDGGVVGIGVLWVHIHPVVCLVVTAYLLGWWSIEV